MLSRTHLGFLYTDIGTGITENDLDVIADSWDMDGREVYRGTRDPRYTHANVHWLYDDSLERVGCVEHSLKDHADFNILWFKDNDFGTLLQEDDWESTQDIWSYFPRPVFDRFINEEWTTPERVLEQCLYGDVRVLTLDTLLDIPTVYTCQTCGLKSFQPKEGCTMTAERLDFPDLKKVFFIDEDLVVYVPPRSSRVWLILQHQLHDDGSLQEQEQVQPQAVQVVQTVSLHTEPLPLPVVPLPLPLHPSRSQI